MLPLFFILYLGFVGFSEGAGILPDGPLDAAIGGSVLFETTKTPPETPFLVVTWSFGANNIGISTPSGENIGVNYTGRARITHSTGSLELSNLTAADSGDYGVAIVPSTGGQESGTITLRVHAPISNVTINPETQKLVEGKDSLRLSCSSSGSPLSFLWMKDGSEITASDRVQITDGGRLLSIANVTRDDQGSYTCKVSNPVNSDTSDPANVTVSYGPEKVKLTPPAGTDHAVGSDITMVCSADSRPPAQFTWFLNGSQLRDIGSELKLVDVQENQSGSYSCQAFNTETLRNQTSEPAVINILATPPGPDCDTGCIVGIVVACVVVVAVAIGVGCYCVQKKKKKKKSTSTTTGGGARGNAGNKNEDLNYADVRFFRNKQGVSVPLGEQNTTTDYAEVRVNNKGPGPSSPPTYDDHMQRTKRSAPQPGVNGGPAHP
ncbi:carcinoembryonic antigen-related cell adhesion molecule 6-like isoform X3 [Salarias fasciatus]|uniref:carcinoembryonic antigen-related cell adhesion molecule 6-like isoform X3 n=1 Tax=Salarias fasciatus TaxID=181472 RepID=UPI00117671E9|nr:carcinoembryonic antigen-related cell adhesion molecule 6-like isoform X3 [Salarias fasciatus]